MVQLPRSFTGELPAAGPGGLWLQADGCCSRASWVTVEISVTGNMALAQGWQTFAHTHGLGRWCTLHFNYDGDATLYVRVFGEDRRRVGCCPEDDDGDEVLGLSDGRDEGEANPLLAVTAARRVSAAPPPATAPPAVAMINHHTAVPALRAAAGRHVAALR